MNTRFNLRIAGRENKDGRKQIIARISYDGKRVEMYTGYLAKENLEWNTSKNELRKSHPDYDKIDRKLTWIRTRAREIYDEAKMKGEDIDPKVFKGRMNESLPKTEAFLVHSRARSILGPGC